MAYNRVVWKDYPNTDTPVTADNLNIMDSGISTNDTAITNMLSGVSEAGKAKKLSDTVAVGNSKTPVYFSNGLPLACSPASEVKNEEGIVSNSAVYNALKNGTVAKLGTSTVGSNIKPVYLSEGTPTASSASVGDVETPVYIDNGEIKVCTLKEPVIPQPKEVSLVTEVYTSSNITIPSSGRDTYTIDITKEGYKPLGIVGTDTSVGNTALEEYFITGNTATVRIVNLGSSRKINVKIYVLYVNESE